MVRRIFFLVLLLTIAGCRNHPDPTVVNAENAKKGEKLFNTVGCLMCHSVSGETKYGPPLNLIFNREVTVMRKGNSINLKVDRQYIFRSMKDPEFEKVAGFQTKKMSLVSLTDDEINYLVDYLIFINTTK